MSPKGYSRLQIGLHWLIAGLLIVSFFSHESMKTTWRALERGAAEVPFSAGVALHVLSGLTILALTLLRLAIRLRRGAPAGPESSPPIMDLAARLAHWALYAVLLVLPASGIAAWFFGVKQAADTHGILFTIAWVLIALHTVAALFHQLVLKDNLLQRMRRPG